MTYTARPICWQAMRKDKAPDTILRLVETFDRNLASYHTSAYNETQLRRDFLDPFFDALGWDVANRKGYDQRYREVVHEDAIKVGGTTKAPDYCFRVGGVRKFFVEAKAPVRDIARDPAPAFQLRRYAWTARLPLSILTDFEEFSVYDTRLRPSESDKAGSARLRLIPFHEYEQTWEELVGTFSPEAIKQGAFDRFAESGKKRGTTPVDAEFLKDIERWRDVLARHIALRNPRLTNRQLNHAVQRTIDRLIFLRICEDRGIEPAGSLQALTNGTCIYPRLFELFRKADDRYNSGLFHFTAERGREEPDDLTPHLKLDDPVLKTIIGQLYYPSPYEFSVFPADILGQVYEQFLGKVIRLTAGHRAKVEEKPEVRKAGGVYYTPTYIVDYIVKNTVGKLLEKRTPKTAARLRILDPACGSGSFLLGAFQYLLDWHRDRYVKQGAAKHRKELYEGPGGEWRLTTQEKKRILLNNIYGVDIDGQAVDVTKLSLLLKVLEGESDQTISLQQKMFHERALPDLAANIKCGNSLIGSDFWQGEQQGLFDDEEQRIRINAFDWDHEFPDIMKRGLPASGHAQAGGFDVVIGNPPYGIVFDPVLKEFLERHYPTFGRNNDAYVAFTQRSISLLATRGLFGFIVPNTFLLGPYFDALKQYILQQTALTEIVDFGTNRVFSGPYVFTALLFLRRLGSAPTRAPAASRLAKVSDLGAFPDGLEVTRVPRSELSSLRWVPAGRLVARLLEEGRPLGDLAWVKDVGFNYWTRGRGKKRGGSIADRVLYEGKRLHPADSPFLKGRDINRYRMLSPSHWLRHDYAKRLDPEVDTFRFSPGFLLREKVIYRQTADRIIATIDTAGEYVDKTVHSVVLREDHDASMWYRYLLGILNSSLLLYLYRHLAQEEGRGFAQVKTFRVKRLPISVPSDSTGIDKAPRRAIVGLVERMLDLHKKLPKAKGESKTAIERRIKATDRKIDELVYELYGLTEKEIRIVEGRPA